jgi:hypothetical protein
MSLFLALLRLAVRLSFLAAALVYVTFSLLGDLEYGLGLRTMELRHFALASIYFPLIRSHRSAFAYGIIQNMEVGGIPAVKKAIRADPNSADLWFGLLRLELQARDEEGYNAAMSRLKELTPGLKYTPILR